MSTSGSSEKTPATGPDADLDEADRLIDATLEELHGEDTGKFFAYARRVDPQAAALARFRFDTQPEAIGERLLAVGILYGAFIGLPALGAVWAAVKIFHGGY